MLMQASFEKAIALVWTLSICSPVVGPQSHKVESADVSSDRAKSGETDGEIITVHNVEKRVFSAIKISPSASTVFFVFIQSYDS
jgi:hypothetical protein